MKKILVLSEKTKCRIVFGLGKRIPHLIDDLFQETNIILLFKPNTTEHELKCRLIDKLRVWKFARKEKIYRRIVSNPENRYVLKLDLEIAMKKLTRKQRLVISLLLKGYNNRQIAEKLKRHETSVCIVKRNAINRLKKYFQGGEYFGI